MSENKKIHLWVWIAWLVLHGYLLCFRFSLGTLAVLALAAGILLLSTWKNKKYEYGFLTNTLGHVLGASLFVQLGWYFVEKILARIMLQENWIENIAKLSGEKCASLFQFLNRDEELVAGIAISAILLVARLCTSNKPRLSMLISYASSAALMYPILDILYHSPVIALLYTIVMLVFIWADLWNIAVEGQWNKCGKRWFNTLIVLLLFAHSWNWYMLKPLTQEGALERLFVLEATRWNHLLVAFGALAGLLAAFDSVTSERAWPNVKILTAIASMLLLTAFLKWFYVGWWWILVLVNVIYLLLDAYVIYLRVADNEDKVIGSLMIQVGIGVLSVLIAVTGHFGTWPVLLALIAAAAVFFWGATKLEGKEEDNKMYVPVSALLMVTAVLIPAFMWLWIYRRLAYSFHMLLILAAVVVGITALLGWHVTKEDRKNVLAPLAAILAFVVLVVNVAMTGGSRIEMELNERGVRVVQAEARGEENQVVSTEYRWSENWLDLNEGTFEVGEEETITSLHRLAGRDGKLRVIVTDRYGIVTETIFWVHTQPQTGSE